MDTKLITIVDNGAEYSDHSLYFVAASPTDVQAVLDMAEHSYGVPFIVGSGMIDFVPNAVGSMTLLQFAGGMRPKGGWQNQQQFTIAVSVMQRAAEAA